MVISSPPLLPLLPDWHTSLNRLSVSSSSLFPLWIHTIVVWWRWTQIDSPHRFPRHLLAVTRSLLILMPMRRSWFAGYGRDWWGRQCKDIQCKDIQSKDIQCTHYWPQTYMDIQSKNENGNIHTNDTRMSKIDSALF